YICATYDGAKFHLYVNGEEVASQKAEGELRPSASPLYLGRYEILDKVYFFKGYLDEVRLYPYALSPEEVKSHYLEAIRR
ncbi:MAG: LamG domain-containing protein, partial [bacterium]